jgi:hypothetical protein
VQGRLWKLPEPWTPRTRLPLLGKRPERVSHSYHKASSSTECYLCCRLTLLPVLPVAQRRDRLAFQVAPKTRLDSEWLVALLARRPLAETIFVDSSVFDNRTSLAVWEALFDRSGGVTIIPSIAREIAPWVVAQPQHCAAQAVRLLDPSIDLWTSDLPTSVDRDVFLYYVSLLSLRKKVHSLVKIQIAERRRTDEAAVHEPHIWESVQQQFGERGMMLAKKGQARVGSENRFTDEKLVVAALLHGITTGRPVCIITKDEDIQEQFYKLAWLLDTQYRGHLLARIFAEGKREFRTVPMPMASPGTAELFAGDDNILLERTTHLQDVLPEFYRPVGLNCLLVGEYCSHMTFMAEAEMGQLLLSKAATSGLNTDSLGGRNCHVAVPHRMSRPYAAIVNDIRATVPDSSAKVSLMDASHVVMCAERFGTRRDL